jgi:hypothetical protein
MLCRHQYQPNGYPNRRSNWPVLGDCQLRRVLASATASTPLNLMHHRLLPPEQLGLIPALATTG